jgi:hypothetical protein
MKWLIFLSLVACSSVLYRLDGGGEKFDLTTYQTLSSDLHPTYAQLVVEREIRSEQDKHVENFLKSKEAALYRLGVAIVEAEWQPTLSGLAFEDQFYLSNRGKQILTHEIYEEFLNSLTQLGLKFGFSVLTHDEVIESDSLKKFGSPYPDYVLEEDRLLTNLDFFFLKKGKAIDSASRVMPRGMQDLSLLKVSAFDLMSGPKPTQHQHHWVNELCEENNLDGIILLNLKAEWKTKDSKTNSNKKNDDIYSLFMSAHASILYPWSKLNKTVKVNTQLPKLNVPLALYKIHHELVLGQELRVNPEMKIGQLKLLTPLKENQKAFVNLIAQRMATDIMQTTAP